MPLSVTFSEPFYTGGSTSSEVPSRYDCALDGRPYMIDTAAGTFMHQTVPLLRAQADQAASPSEASINPDDLWRRSMDTWHQGAGQCLTADTRVLTSDLRWIPCGDLEVGDGLVAFEDMPTNRKARQWQAATVTGTGRIVMPCFRMLMSDGTKFIASHNHRWLRQCVETFGWLETERIRSSQVHGKWATKLCKVIEPWQEDRSWRAGYLAAAFDGEGCLTQTPRPPRKDRLMLTFCQRDNAMLALVKAELTTLGFEYSHGTQAGKNGDVAHINILGGTTEILRLLGSVRPRRLLDKFQPLNNGVMWAKPVEVVEVEFIGEQEVVALETSTGTFLAEGFATHNTYLDRDDSEPARFHTSKGVDVWTKWELSLLPDTDQKRASANTNLGLAVAGSRLYAIDGGSLLYATDVTADTPTFTTVTGLTPSPTVLDSSISGTDASSAVSASVSPVANALLLCAVESSHGAAATLPTVTGLGLTWVQVATILQGSSLNRLTVFRAMGSTTPTPGTVTIDFGGTTQTGISYSLTQWTGVDITGTNGSGAVVQAPTNKDDTGAALSLAVTAAAFGSTRNATWGVFRIDNTGNRTLGTGFTSLVNGTHASPNARFSSEWTASNDTSVDMTFASAGSILGIAIEIKAAAAATPTSIATDGTNVWVAAGASGILTTTSAASAATTYNTGTVNIVGYVKGRLMAATGNVLYNIIASGALPTALLTHPNAGFTWVGFAEGPSVIYAAGYSGDKSLIYKTAIKADGTALDVPTVAGELPDGEIVRSVQGYLGFLCIGTDLGVRFAAPDDNGNLTIGSLIPTTSGVYCFEPQDRYVWYGLTNYDTSSTGLGRMDLTTLTAPLTPAYASDLMVTGQGAVLAAATFQSLRVLAVSGLGFYAETTTLVSSGTIDSGQITYKLPDEKVGLYVDVHHDLVGTHAVSVSVDGGAFVSLGSHDAADTPFVVGELRGSRHEVRLTLSTLAGTGPTIRSWTLRSYPTAATVLIIIVPLILAEWVELLNGTTASCDPAAELAAMDALRRNRSLVQLQLGATTYSVTVEDYQWQPTHRTKDNDGWNGTLTPKLKAITA